MHPDTHLPATDSGRLGGLFMPALLALALLAILYSVPQPTLQVNQPFKAELLVSLFLIVFLSVTTRRKTFDLSPQVKAIALSIAGFVLWSGSSALWATSFSDVAHHTLLWSLYLVVFVIFAGKIWPDANFRSITTTFVITALILGLLCVFDYLSTPDFTASEGLIRIRYGKYAELLATVSPLLWAAALYTRKRKTLVVLAALLSWITVMLSLSKGAFLAGIIGFAIFFAATFLFSAKVFRKRIAVFACVWLAVTIATQVFFSYFSAVPSTTSYITGAADATRSTSTMRLFTWSVGREMARDNLLFGVGADNFGVAFNRQRISFNSTKPITNAAEIGEDYVVERAHNEPLQVVSELGVIGLVLVATPFILFVIYAARKFFHGGLRSSPILWAAFAGMSAFAVSSQFSSFSFRAAQNGVAFFIVFAVAVNELSKPRRKALAADSSSTYIFAASWFAILLMTAFCAVKIFAQYHAYFGERSTVYNDAVRHFQTAVTADTEYAGAYLLNAGRAIREDDHPAAAHLTQKAIDHGLGITTVYSMLAKQHAKAEDLAAAEAAYREGVAIFQQSVYLRMEFVVFLESLGKQNDAEEHAAIARSIDQRQANGWYLIIKEGSVAAFYRSQADPNIAPPADLLPFTAVRQYVDEVPGM